MPGAISFGAGAVEVEGLGDLQRALKELDVTLNKRLRESLIQVAQPVAETAQGLALKKITRMKFGRGSHWSSMRIGVTTGLVYIAPKERGVKGGTKKRPNLATLLVVKAMEPAAEKERSRVEAELERTLEVVFREAGV